MDERALILDLVRDPEFARIDSYGSFNLFEAAGLIRQEIRHTRFLAYLLDPRKPHGLADGFLRRFLLRALESAPACPIHALDIELADLSSAIVRPEWKGIDLFIRDRETGLTCLVENKVDADERGDQLARYYSAARRQHPEDTLLAVYLTPEGRDSSHDEYGNVAYAEVVADIEELVEERALKPDVRIGLEHYVNLIREHVLEDEELRGLCERVYERHAKAIDLINRYRPDTLGSWAALLNGLVDSEERVTLISRGKARIKFYASDWRDHPLLTPSGGWEKSPCVYFEVRFDEAPRIYLYSTSDSAVSNAEKVFAALAQGAEKAALPGRSNRAGTKWKLLHRFDLVSEDEFERSDAEGLAEEVESRWQQWVKRDLPDVAEAIGSVSI